MEEVADKEPDPGRTLLGAVSLGFWGGAAGRRAGLTGWRLVRAVMAGLLIGVLILALQVFLQPGKPASLGALQRA